MKTYILHALFAKGNSLTKVWEACNLSSDEAVNSNVKAKQGEVR